MRTRIRIAWRMAYTVDVEVRRCATLRRPFSPEATMSYDYAALLATQSARRNVAGCVKAQGCKSNALDSRQVRAS